MLTLAAAFFWPPAQVFVLTCRCQSAAALLPAARPPDPVGPPPTETGHRRSRKPAAVAAACAIARDLSKKTLIKNLGLFV
jgi:hypothetical protein